MSSEYIYWIQTPIAFLFISIFHIALLKTLHKTSQRVLSNLFRVGGVLFVLGTISVTIFIALDGWEIGFIWIWSAVSAIALLEATSIFLYRAKIAESSNISRKVPVQGKDNF